MLARMKFHWKVLLWMLGGIVAGLVMQWTLEMRPTAGASFTKADGGVVVTSVAKGGAAAKAKLAAGDVVTAATLHRGSQDAARPEETIELAGVDDLSPVFARTSVGDVVWLRIAGRAAGDETLLTVGLDPDCALSLWIAPFAFLADIFMALLKMLIVPLVLTSIVTGVAGIGDLKDLRRLGGKTFAYYLTTSLLAIVVGQVLVSVIRPGDGAELGLAAIDKEELAPDASFVDVLKRMVPSNVIESMGDNGSMLSIIFFALMLGFFITRTPDPFGSRARELFSALFHVMMKMAEGVLTLLPFGVFCLMARVVAKTGFSVFEPLLLYMATVALALVIHAAVTLPLVLRAVGGMRPSRWLSAMSPAIMTAFSTSSSSMTLPVTMETVEKRGKVSNRVTSFTLPLGATINMDGTALYECIGVIFLAQYYATTGDYDLTLGKQALVVVMALLASIGAAGIPSAGLVMMLTILATLGLPLEGAALLLAVDRPLDMMRTVVNVWSDSCGAAVIARTEGEGGPLEAGAT